MPVKTTTSAQDDKAYDNPAPAAGTVRVSMHRDGGGIRQIGIFNDKARLMLMSKLADEELNKKPDEDGSAMGTSKKKREIILPSYVDITAVKEVLFYMEKADPQRGHKPNNGYCGNGQQDPSFTQVMNLHCAAEAFKLREEYRDDRIYGSLVRYIKGKPKDRSQGDEIRRDDNGMELTFKDFTAAIRGEKCDKRIAKCMKQEVVWCERTESIDVKELQKINESCEGKNLEQEMAGLREELTTKHEKKTAKSDEYWQHLP